MSQAVCEIGAMNSNLENWRGGVAWSGHRRPWSQEPSDVVRRIRRRYRQRFKTDEGWRDYVAGIVGVTPYTVGAWRVGTMRPTPERAEKLRQVCRALGSGRRGLLAKPNGPARPEG